MKFAFLVAFATLLPTGGAGEIIHLPIRSTVEVGLVDAEHPEDREFWRVDLVTTTEEGQPASVVARVQVMSETFSTNGAEELERLIAALAAARAAIEAASGGGGGGGGLE